jgi:ribosomal protein L11 methyltransferase
LLYSALNVANADGDLVLVIADDYFVTAVEYHDDGSLSIFFSDGSLRDTARDAIARRWPEAVLTAREVDDGDWARRSQEGLQPITVGRITIVPDSKFLISNSHAIVIEPSMGFGTGHHATTRLCLTALQNMDLAGADVVDIGTGSGVLAIAARLLGARKAVGIDSDPDAIRAATDNLRLNPAIDGVQFVEADLVSWLSSADSTRGDVVTANLTGALLSRSAKWLAGAVVPGGSLIVSGILMAERGEVAEAFAPFGLQPVREAQEDEWWGSTFRADF